MRKLSQLCAVLLLVVTAAFTPAVEQVLYPDLVQSFKELKKTKITYERQDQLTGVQQMGIMAKQQKKAVVFELMGKDGFTAPFAKAVLTAALAANGITDAKVVAVGASPNDKVAPALTALGFKVTGNEAKYGEAASPVSLDAQASDPAAVHVLLTDDAASLLTAPDKFAVKLHYGTDADAKLIAAEMLFIASQVKFNWKY